MAKLVLSLLAAGIVPAFATTAFIGADSHYFQYTGRVAKDGNKVLWDWSGVKATIRLKCPANVAVDVQFRIELPSLQTFNPGYQDRDASKYIISVNGLNHTGFQTYAPLKGPETTLYNVTFPAIADEFRVIEMVKNTEQFTVPVWASWSEGGSPTKFDGMIYPSSCYPHTPPARPSRRIEFLGDSITCGFGDLADGIIDKVECVLPPISGLHGWLDFEDFSKGFPTLTSNAFKAEQHTQCISQIGITRNGVTLSKRTPYNMSWYIDRTMPSVNDTKFMWDYRQWLPDLAVVNLGTNDYDISSIVHEQPSFADFEGNYTKFLADYIDKYSFAIVGVKLKHLLVLCGPMTSMQCPSVEKVTVNLKTMFPKLNVKYLRVTLTKNTGCIGHPGAEGHQQLYEQLAPVISEMTGWSTSESPTALIV